MFISHFGSFVFTAQREGRPLFLLGDMPASYFVTGFFVCSAAGEFLVCQSLFAHFGQDRA
jgi:hypothetical protein